MESVLTININNSGKHNETNIYTYYLPLDIVSVVCHKLTCNMHNNSANLLPTTFSSPANLNVFVTDLLMSLTIARVTLIFNNQSTEIANIFLTSKESSNIKWHTLNIDRPYKNETYALDRRTNQPDENFQDPHLIVLAFNTRTDTLGIGLYTFELIWQLHGMRRWKWQGKSNYLLVTDNEFVKEQEIHERLQSLREYDIYVVMVRYTNSGLVQICKVADDGQLKCLVYTETMWSSGTLHDSLYESDLFVDQQGKSLYIHANLCAPQLFYGRLENSVNDKLEKNTVGGTYVHLATMLARYLNANVTFILSDYLHDVQDEPRFWKYIINEIERIRKTDVILPSSLNMS